MAGSRPGLCRCPRRRPQSEYEASTIVTSHQRNAPSTVTLVRAARIQSKHRHGKLPQRIIQITALFQIAARVRRVYGTRSRPGFRANRKFGRTDRHRRVKPHVDKAYKRGWSIGVTCWRLCGEGLITRRSRKAVGYQRVRLTISGV